MKAYYLHPRRIYEIYAHNKDMLFAYETIVYHARFTPATVSGINVKAGQLLITTAELADLCKTNKHTMRYILKRFTADGGIRTENCGKNGILITLLSPFITGENHSKETTTANKTSTDTEKRTAEENTSTAAKRKNNSQDNTYSHDSYAGYDLSKIDFSKAIIYPKGKRRINK